MNIGFGELFLLALLGFFLFKPPELRRLARTAGQWMHKIRRTSREFTNELVREGEFEEIREQARELKREVMSLAPPPEVQGGDGPASERASELQPPDSRAGDRTEPR